MKKNKILLYGLAGGFLAILAISGIGLAALFAATYVGTVWVRPILKKKDENKKDEDVKKEEVKKVEIKPEVKKVEIKSEEIKKPEVKKVEIKSEEIKKPEEIKPEIKKPEIKPEEDKIPEIKPEIKTENAAIIDKDDIEKEIEKDSEPLFTLGPRRSSLKITLAPLLPMVTDEDDEDEEDDYDDEEEEEDDEIEEAVTPQPTEQEEQNDVPATTPEIEEEEEEDDEEEEEEVGQTFILNIGEPDVEIVALTEQEEQENLLKGDEPTTETGEDAEKNEQKEKREHKKKKSSKKKSHKHKHHKHKHSSKSKTSSTPEEATATADNSAAAAAIDIPPPESEEVQKKRRIFKKVMQEIIDTERSYIRMLELVKKIYIEPLRTASPQIISEQQIKEIFSIIEIIVAINAQVVLKELEKWDGTPGGASPGEIFERVTASAEMLSTYITYINNYDNSSATVTKLRQNLPKFAKFLNDRSRLPEAENLTLEALLIMPVQRIPV